MSFFRYTSRIHLTQNIKSDSYFGLCSRFLSYVPMHYGDNPDPGPIFIKEEVQSLLRTLTRVDLATVFKKRKLGGKYLHKPVYKFMTNEQLNEALKEARKKVDNILQIPPVVSIRKPRNAVISKDPALQGLDESTFIFTDITYGVSDQKRIILMRDPEGTLKEADWDIRSRVNQVYFPVPLRQVRIPKMFEDSYLEDLLKRHEHIFVLDRACLQFEPNDPLYQKVVSVTYQHVNDNNEFKVLRSTRHFGSFVFFLSWHKMIDNLLLELIETEHIDEAKALVDLYSRVHNINFKFDENLNEIETYIKRYAAKKGALELALQAFRNAEKMKQELEQGIRKAHGLS